MLGVLLILNIFPWVAISQSKHVSRFFIGGYYLDLNHPSVEVCDNVYLKEYYDVEQCYYVDENGDTRLIGYDGILHDADNNVIEGSSMLVYESKCFVPGSSSNIVHYFGRNYMMIDLEKNKVIKKIDNFETGDIVLAVHKSDCSGVWLFYSGDDEIRKYLLSNDEVIYCGSEDWIFENKKQPSRDNDLYVMLSPDCKHFTSVLRFAELHYGDFDRMTGTFKVKSIKLADFPDEFYITSAFSYDGKKIYCNFIHDKSRARVTDLLEYDLKDGYVDFGSEKITNIIDYYGIELSSSPFYDVFHHKTCFYSYEKYAISLSTDKLGNTEMEYIYVPSKDKIEPSNQIFPASWFSANPCDGESPPCFLPVPKILRE